MFLPKYMKNIYNLFWNRFIYIFFRYILSTFSNRHHLKVYCTNTNCQKMSNLLATGKNLTLNTFSLLKRETSNCIWKLNTAEQKNFSSEQMGKSSFRIGSVENATDWIIWFQIFFLLFRVEETSGLSGDWRRKISNVEKTKSYFQEANHCKSSFNFHLRQQKHKLTYIHTNYV